MNYYKFIVLCLSFYGNFLHAETKIPNWTVFSEYKVIKVITKEEDQVAVGDWVCTVGKIKKDISGNENRRFGCSIDGKPQVYVFPTCAFSKKNKRLISSDSGFNIQMKHESAVFVQLRCDDVL